MRKLLLLLAAGGSAAAVAPEKPNIVFIMADDVGDQAIGCYGGQSYATPRVDALAGGGVRFRHCYSMPVCHPSRIAIMTGKYPFRVGSPRWGSFPQAEEAGSIGNALKKLGYATAVAGKWQLTMLRDEPDHPHRLGFDAYALFGWHEGPRYYRPLIYENGRVRSDVSGRYGPDVYVEFLAAFIERHKDKPFFAYYPMALAHDVTDDIGEPPPLGPQGHYDSYKVMVENMDERVGRIVDALDEAGVRGRTLVIFTADNGTPKSFYYTAQGQEMLKQPIEFFWKGQKTKGGKGELTDAGTRVPLIANWPGVLDAGLTVDDLVDFSDWLPTFVELAGGTPPVGLNGKSLAARLRGEGPGKRRYAFAERNENRTIRTQRWKLYDDGRLFDMSQGRQEEAFVPVDRSSAEAHEARLELTRAMRAVVQ